MFSLHATRVLDARPERAWEVVADYARDPDWRGGVCEMLSDPGGLAAAGTVTHEVLRVAGRTYRNDGVVERVVPGRRLEWRTTSGAVAHGSREVRPLGTDRCEVALELHVEPTGANRLLAPLLRRVLARGLVEDLRRLDELVAAGERVVA